METQPKDLSFQSAINPTKEQPNQNDIRNTQAQRNRTSSNEGRKPFYQEQNRGRKHIFYSELMNRKAEGFCFRGSECFHPRSQYANKQWCLVISGNDEERSKSGEVIAMEVKDRQEEDELQDVVILRSSGMDESNREWISVYGYRYGPGLGKNPNVNKGGFGLGPNRGAFSKGSSTPNESRDVVHQGSRPKSSERRLLTCDLGETMKL